MLEGTAGGVDDLAIPSGVFGVKITHNNGVGIRFEKGVEIRSFKRGIGGFIERLRASFLSFPNLCG